ncbi:MAG: hypothetical protein M3Q75_05230 [Gemmatimonadota bacterium]|jgi:hypothetical protein|nr:hypothetical protein [Gemmatimonadota bacterium]
MSFPQLPWHRCSALPFPGVIILLMILLVAVALLLTGNRPVGAVLGFAFTVSPAALVLGFLGGGPSSRDGPAADPRTT